jgi:hypothetical protein
MKDHLLRCRCASGAHGRTQYAALRSQGAQCAPVQYCHGPTESALLRLASGPFLNWLREPFGRTLC